MSSTIKGALQGPGPTSQRGSLRNLLLGNRSPASRHLGELFGENTISGCPTLPDTTGQLNAKFRRHENGFLTHQLSSCSDPPNSLGPFRLIHSLFFFTRKFIISYICGIFCWSCSMIDTGYHALLHRNSRCGSLYDFESSQKRWRSLQ